MTDTPTAATDSSWSRRLDDTGVPLLLARLVLGGTFLWLGSNKLSDPVTFLKLIREYGLVPESLPMLLNTLAVALPWLEIWCGLLLLAGVAVRGAGYGMLLLLIVFSGAILMRALDIQAAEQLAFCAIKFDCGCGTGEEFVCSKLPQNLGLIALSVLTVWSRTKRFCLRARLLGNA
jgi:uncharacterized membrane protein YphA (DoxX/SURF4 family)